jgi:asparagine synthase (glutamine-hydrolysing)
MDSSSIVCVADRIIEGSEQTVRALDTVSYFDDLEPNWNERPFVAIVERHRSRAGYHIDAPQCLYLAKGGGKERFDATPCSVGASPDAARRFADCLSSESYRVLLSGIGGDEVTGGVPTPLPELADALARAKFIELFRLLMTWALKKRKPWPHLLLELIREFLPRNLSSLTTIQSRQAPWLKPSFLHQHRLAFNPKQRLRLFSSLPSFQDNLRTLEVLRRQMACSAVLAEPLYEMRYPYLDRDLLEFLFAVPPHQLLRPGQRRSLMRRALRGIVPEEILDRRRKAAVARSPMVAISQALDDLFEANQEMASEIFGLVNSAVFRDAVKRIQVDETVPLIPVIRTIGMEVWLRQLTASGLVYKHDSDWLKTQDTTKSFLGQDKSQTGKEVKLMEYTKPEIVASAEAIVAIQGTKTGQLVDSQNINLPMQTAAAYEADE